jgi:tripartite-type tricarboxylate transporter receptor subunit TctC
VIPTRAGGALERNFRSFIEGWKNTLPGALFEPHFYPGAGGRVGYRIYVRKNEPDAYNLVLGSMGSAALNFVMKPPTEFAFPGDFKFFMRIDHDPMVAFVRQDSPFKTIEDVVKEGQKRTISIATPRLAHPGTIGFYELQAATGARFNVVPMSGGRKTFASVVTGEIDAGCIGGGGVASQGEALRPLAIFDDKNRFGPVMEGVPTINSVFGTSFPPLASSRAWAIHTKAIEKYPDRYRTLTESMKKVYDDPAFKAALLKTGQPWETIWYGDEKACDRYLKNIFELGSKYRKHIIGKKKSKK